MKNDRVLPFTHMNFPFATTWQSLASTFILPGPVLLLAHRSAPFGRLHPEPRQPGTKKIFPYPPYSVPFCPERPLGD
ncbi:MAG: hypothetical protein OXH65_02940 [Paracoccaceae bacterium]|nr:hypothetical protein [Paracoccaceae bacterium]